MLTMVGMASDPISRGMGAVVIRVYLSMCLCFITVFSWIAGANLVNLADGGLKKEEKDWRFQKKGVYLQKWRIKGKQISK